MSNEYDDLLATEETATGANEYDAQLQLEGDQERSALRGTLYGAVRSNPDQYAQARRLSVSTGIPAPVIERNLPAIEQREKVNEYDALLESTPALRSRMADPDFAKITHDDLENAGLIEQTLRVLKRSGRALASGVPRFTEGGYGAVEGVVEAVGSAQGRRYGFPNNWLEPVVKFLRETRQGQGQLAEAVAGSREGAGDIEQGVYSGLESISRNAAPLLAAVYTSNPNIALTGMSASVGGSEYGRARDQGLPPEKALPFAATQAAIEYATEKLPVGRLLGDLKTGTPFWQTLTRNLATEIPGEQAATILQDLNEWAVLHPEKPFSDYLAERPSAAAQTLVATFVASGGQTAVAGAANAFARRQERAQEATRAGEAFTELQQLASASKLLERSPESFKQFVEAATEDEPVSEVFIDARVLSEALNQAGVTMEEVLPSAAPQFAEAVVTGGDVRLTVGEYSAHFAAQDFGAALLPHLRTSPEAMSAAEAQVFMQSGAEAFQAEAEKALAADEVNQAEQAGAAVVETAVLEQLRTANRFTDDVNTAYATLMRDFYVTSARQLGITPEEMLQRYPLQVRAEGVAGERTLEQPALTPEDQEIEGRFAQAIDSDVDAAVEAYAQLPDSDGGRIINTDIARELSPDYLADRTKSVAVYEPASALVKEIYARKLAEEPKEGQEPVVVFSAGGTGAGKTTGLRTVMASDPDVQAAQVIYDTNMNTFENSVAKIEQALAADKDVVIVYTYREPVNALVSGALMRAMRQEGEFGSGRTVPLREHARTHVGSLQTIRALAEKYAGDPRVQIRAVDNSGSKGQQAIVKLDKLPDLDYTSVLGELNEALETARLAGSISEAVYAGTRDAAQGTGGSDSQGDRRRLAQGDRGATRGQIAFGPDIRQGAVISLLKNADLSTFLHESGHFFLEVYTDIASRPGTPPGVAADMAALLKWFGVKDLATWQGMTLEQRRDKHEKFARGFEAYLFEGKAPSTELAGLFSRFRAWLLNVYKSLASLNVEFTAEVRGVFDRMLATDSAIAAAQAARSYAPLFESAEQAGMTEQEWQAYQALGAEASQDAVDELQKRSLRDMRWLTNAKGRELKKLQADAASKRKAVREEVAAEVRAEPAYAAQRFIQRGELELPDQTNKQRKVAELAGMVGTKLSLPALKAMYGEEANAPWRYLNTGRFGDVTAADGLHPDMVAELFGFTSGDHLVRALLEAEPINDVIDAKTDQRTLERFGDITDPAAQSRAADEAVHNEARARFVASEIRALEKATGKPRTLAKAARAFAEATVARKRVRDVKPAQFAASEARAAKAASALMADGKLTEAASEKRNQLVNAYATRAAHEALAEVQKGVEYLAKFNRDGTRKSLDVEYVDQIDQLLERFDLRRGQSLTAIDKRKSLAKWIEAQQALGFEPAIDDDMLNEARRQHYRDTTVEQFRGLVDSVRNIEHLGRLKKKLLTARAEREFTAAVDEAATTIRDNAKKTIPPELEHNTFGSRVKSGVNEFFAMHRKLASLIRQMDGFKDGGVLWELFIRPMNTAGDAESTKRAAATKELSKIFKPVLKVGQLRQKLFIPAISTSLSREGRLSIALNWGNETNRLRVLEGERWSPAQAQAVLDTLTKEEWDFVQSTWDYIGTYWADIADKERRISGVTPERVEAAPVQTQFGELKGGYYPIKYDPARSTRAEADTLAESVRQAMQGLYTRATTRRGHTKARAESVQRPMRKDLGVIFEHVEQVIHDLSWHEYLIDANRLLRASAIDGAIREHYGPEVLRVMRQALDDIAAGDAPAQNQFERSINYLRQGASIVGLGWNITTGLLQPFGLTQSMVRIGPKWVGRGLARWLGGAARMENTAKWIYDKSEFMRLRGQTMQREINEIRNRVQGKKVTAVQESYFWLIQTMQRVADIPTWLGAYEKAMDSTSGDEATAIALADQAVLDAQGSGQVKDLAAIQRGGPLLKLWTNFYNFFNTTLNLTAESAGRTNWKKPADVGRFAVDMLLLYTVPSVLGTLLRDALSDDDDEDIAPKLARDQLNYLLGVMVGLREIGGAVQGFDYAGPAASRFFSEMSKLTKQVEQGELDEAAIKALNRVAGILFHYPAGQVERTAEGVIALAEGETVNPGVLATGTR